METENKLGNFGDLPDIEEFVNVSLSQIVPADSTVAIKIKPELDSGLTALRSEIDKISDYAIQRAITTEADLTPATHDLTLISQLKKALKVFYDEYTKPINQHLDDIRAVFKPITELLDSAEKINKAKVSAFIDTQKARAVEAERLNREAAELARKQAEFSGTGEITVDTTPLEAPAPIRKVSTGSGSISEVPAPSTWVLEDWDKVPKEYKILDTIRINKIVRAGGSIPGIKITTHTGIRTNTK